MKILIKKMNHIIDDIYISDMKTAYNPTLIKIKIKTIISLSDFKLQTPCSIEKDHHYNFIIKDRPQYSIIPFCKQIFKILQVTEKPVLVHCHQGISRSVSVVLYYIMMKHNMTFYESYDFIRERRTIAHINRGFFKQLLNYYTGHKKAP